MGNSGMIAGAFSSTSGKADTVLTTDGDVLYYNSGRQRLAIGAEGKVLTVSSSDLPAWETAGGLSSPLTANLVVNDSIQIQFGTGGSDSGIYHDGSNLYTSISTGYGIYQGDFTMSSGKCMTNNSANATISSGTITGSSNTMRVDTEGAASTDDLDSASFAAASATGAYFSLVTQNDSRDVTVKDQAVSPFFLMAGDFTLDTTQDMIFFNALNGRTHNHEISRSNNS